jgi:Uma2 family endonuclease
MAPQASRKLTYEDIPDDPVRRRRHELVRGEMFVNPSPGTLHQRVVRRLLRQLEDYFEPRGIGEVFIGPTDLILTQHDVFVPDLVVAARPGDVTKRGIEAPPLLVVEVLSPSNRTYDRELKAQRYAELGVRHLWLVDPEERAITCLGLSGDRFVVVAEIAGDGALSHPDFPELIVDTAALWR